MYYRIQQGLLLIGFFLLMVGNLPWLDTAPKWLRVSWALVTSVAIVAGVIMEMRAHRIHQRNKRNNT